MLLYRVTYIIMLLEDDFPSRRYVEITPRTCCLFVRVKKKKRKGENRKGETVTEWWGKGTKVRCLEWLPSAQRPIRFLVVRETEAEERPLGFQPGTRRVRASLSYSIVIHDTLPFPSRLNITRTSFRSSSRQPIFLDHSSLQCSTLTNSLKPRSRRPVTRDKTGEFILQIS